LAGVCRRPGADGHFALPASIPKAVARLPGKKLLPDCQEVCDGVYWGGDFELLKELIKEGSIDKAKIKFFLGYSGWSQGQLDAEMDEKSWLTVAANTNLVFDIALEEIWQFSLKELGGRYALMIHFPTDPQLN